MALQRLLMLLMLRAASGKDVWEQDPSSTFDPIVGVGSIL